MDATRVEQSYFCWRMDEPATCRRSFLYWSVTFCVLCTLQQDAPDPVATFNMFQSVQVHRDKERRDKRWRTCSVCGKQMLHWSHYWEGTCPWICKQSDSPTPPPPMYDWIHAELQTLLTVSEQLELSRLPARINGLFLSLFEKCVRSLRSQYVKHLVTNTINRHTHTHSDPSCPLLRPVNSLYCITANGIKGVSD